MRQKDEIRIIKITKNYTKYAEGSVLIECGDTKVVCTASIEDKVPPFLKNTGTGWISAEYSMLPRANKQRKLRDSTKGKVDGRSHEIQRLIGRSLRASIDMKKLGERTIWIDCDVLQADGGTRTASVNGSFVALALACKKLYDKKIITEYPLHSYISAISVGVVKSEPVLDLSYEQDSNADVDMNIVMSNAKDFVEVQGTGEKINFSRDMLNNLLDLAIKGNNEIIKIQKNVLGDEITSLIGEKRKIDELVIATKNENKLKEISNILTKYEITIKSLEDYDISDDVEENGTTFEENALIKARYYSQRTGKIVMSDDSGLMVDALGGAPGIYSKRYSGEEENTDFKNNEKLLKALLGKTSDERSAKFVTVTALVFPDGTEHTFTGECKGHIGFSMMGDKGFGYDPLFMPDEIGSKTFAQLGPEIKNKISHRAKSLEKLEKFIKG